MCPRTGHDGKYLLDKLQVVGLVELGCVVAAREHDQQLQQQVEARVGHVALCVAECPHDRVNHQLQLPRRHREQCGEACIGDCAQQVEELQPVLGVVLRPGIAMSMG